MSVSPAQKMTQPVAVSRGEERYSVKQDLLSISLAKGDWVEVVNTEGAQRGYLLALDVDSQSDIESTGLKSNGVVFGDVLRHCDFVSRFEKITKQNKGLDSNTPVVELFSDSVALGCAVSFEAQRAVHCVIVAPGRDMLVDDHNSPTDLVVQIRRVIGRDKISLPLPPPLAKPIQDFRIKHSTASAYKVKAGEYIQIVDVEGHQCSDFQAFAVSDISAHENRGFCIDPTTTRSYMGSIYPEPGLYSKYYNENGIALVEVVHDTVGRHDTFGLACYAKYYEDKGYPGHANCTDNFNQALSEYDIAPRNSWMTINLFFNTQVKECHGISSDVSWSRPGDYVMFKALTDLICVTSACPDDIDPANDWNPTDIHVRVYGKDHDFTPATAFRPTTEAVPMMTKETGFHSQTSKLTRNFSNYNGYWLPLDYTDYGAIKEYWACRQGVIVTDLSPLRKFEIYGEDAEILMQYALPRDIRKLAVGQVVYTAICYENGCMMDDGTLFRLCDNNFRWICGSDYSGVWLRDLAEKKGLNVRVKSSTDQLHNISVQGPNSREVLQKIIWTPKDQPSIEELKWFRFSIARIGSEKGLSVILSRTGYTGELGYELICHPKDASSVWQAVWEAGKEYQISPLGLDALDMLRIESGLIFAGYEFDDQTDPFEAGVGFTVPPSKEEDFIGREALLRRKKSPERTLVGLELTGSEVALHGDGVFQGRQQIGVITSATRSPILKKNIALCRVSIEYSAIGTQLEVGKLDGHQKRISAEVVRFPFYDPDKMRVRM